MKIPMIGTKDGISTYNGIRFENFALKADSSVLPVGCITQSNDGRIWVGTGRGIYTVKNGEATYFSKDHPKLQNNISTIFVDSKSVIWIGNDKGLHRVDGDNIVSFKRNVGLANRRIRGISEDLQGRLWIGTYGGGLQWFDGEVFKTVPSQYGEASDIINDVLVDSKGKVWAASLKDGVFCWNPNDSTFTNISQKEGITNNHVRTILEDRWGNMWFGTSGGGANKYFIQPFDHFNKSSGMPGTYTYSLVSHKDDMWMGIDEKGVARYDGKSFTVLSEDSGFISCKVRALYSSLEGDLWLGTDGFGVWRYDGEKFTQVRIGTNREGVSDTWIKCITQSPDSAIWIGTYAGGITKLTPDSGWNNYSASYYSVKNSGLPHNKVNALHVDKEGRIWFGTFGGGLGFLDGEKFTVINTSDGLPSNHIRSLVEDDAGFLWAAGADGALIRINLYGSSWDITLFGYNDGLSSTNVYLLSPTANSLWVGTEKGIDRVMLDQSRNIFAVEHFGMAEGFIGIETNSNAVASDNKGNLWFGTVEGATRYNPKYNLKDHLAPIVSFTNISLFYKPFQESEYSEYIDDWNTLKEGLALNHRKNNLSFGFIGINHKNADGVRYQWRLDGFEEEWSPISNKTDATYSNIPPGNYTFMVRACNADLVWSEPQEVKFSTLPPYWKTWWFISSMILFGILIVTVIFRIRVRRVTEEAQREQQRLKMEKDMVRLEQKALRLQMNPHFIFNALNSIQGLIGNQDDKTARYYLAKFSKLMRLTLENSRVQRIPLDTEIKTLTNYMTLERFSSGEQFDFNIECDEDLDPEELMIPPMMIQPFVENAIIHGVSKTEHPGQINVLFECEDDKIICSISDNGIGRKKAAEVKSQKNQHHKSTALVVTQERLDILNVGGNGQKSLEIIDLHHDDGEPAGTKIMIRIPLMEG
jgi:ligand-binding sensor domain-containing protein/two-component sensor histidine kinase